MLISFCLPIHKPLGKVHGILAGWSTICIPCNSSVLPDPCLILIRSFFSSLLDAQGLTLTPKGTAEHCILWPCSITMKQSESCGRVVKRYKCQFLSSHLSTRKFFFDILASLWCTLTGSVCTLRLFNNAFYVHILFTFFHGVSWQRIKYIYFKVVWELLLHFHLQ